MGDHGWLSFAQNPAVLVKWPDTRQETLEVNEAPASYLTNWPDTLLSLMFGDEAYPNSMLHMSNDADGMRTFYYYYWDNGGWVISYLPDIYELSFHGKARDLDREESLTGNVYRSGAPEKRYLYHLGEAVSGANVSFKTEAIRYGARLASVNTMILEDNVKIELELDRKPEKNLMLHFDLYTVYGYTQEIEVRVNGNSVGKMHVTKGDETADFLIPASVIDDKEITLELLAPDADIRMLDLPSSIRFNSFQLAETDETSTPERIVPTLNEDTKIEVKNGKLYSKVQIHGQWPETKGICSSDILSFQFNTDRQEDIAFSMTYWPFYPLDALMTFNGHEIVHIIGTQSPLDVVLPKEYLSKEGPQEILIQVFSAKSPYELGASVDRRVLGLMVQEASICFLDDTPAVNEDGSMIPAGEQT